MSPDSPLLLRARTAVAWSFALNGFAFAGWASRIPDVRRSLELSNGALGLLLLMISVGSLGTLVTAGAAIHRWGTTRVVRAGVVLVLLGLSLAAVAVTWVGGLPLAVAGLIVYGAGIGVWDVAMNVEGAEVERELRRSVMPRFHAAFSLGTVAGALVGALAAALEVSSGAHLVTTALLVGVGGQVVVGAFLPDEAVEEGRHQAPRRAAWRAWLEPRTLLVGLMVLSLAVTEGTANDWLAVALIDGHGVEHWVGVAGFAAFVSAMTLGRFVGTVLLDRWGRLPVLWGTMLAAGVGVLMVVYGAGPVVLAGILLWGAGASLGFPVGMSAAADDPAHAAARVSVVSAIAYTAFLAGPPLLGFLADRVGTLHALLAVAVLLVPSLLVVPAARPPATDEEPVRA